MTTEASKDMNRYFAQIDAGVSRAYAVGKQARAKGFDPEKDVSVPLAKDMAERVEGIVSSVCSQLAGSGLAQRIKELGAEMGDLEWRVALRIALEVAEGKFCSFRSKLLAMETGIRVGIAYLTLGIVASPLEGFVELKINTTADGKEYFSLMYSGPIRSAGGTAAAVSVIVADYIRVKMGYAAYDPTEKEIERAVTELYDYHERITNLQYLPSREEVRFLAQHLPVQINGDPSEQIEVSNFKDVDRIETNRIRSGVCLVLAEGIAQKAKKVHKQLSGWAAEYGLEHWGFLGAFLSLQAKAKSQGEVQDGQKVAPIYTYIQDLVAGRPVLTHPMRPGGFRLRYGRCRASGYSSASVHPATTYILNEYLAVGTQLKVERPGKATAITCCDTVEGPVVLLRSGEVLILSTLELAKKHFPELHEILFLGDLLFSYGDFFNRAHPLVPCGYCEEWWAQEMGKAVLERKGGGGISAVARDTGLSEEELHSLIRLPHVQRPGVAVALKLSVLLRVPLHPSYTHHWGLLSAEEFFSFLEMMQGASFVEGKKGIQSLVLPFKEGSKGLLEKIGMPHTIATGGQIVIKNPEAATLVALFALRDEGSLGRWKVASQEGKPKDTLACINSLSPIKMRDKSGTFVGARMGRPEKAKMRKLTGSPHVLFPVGSEGGKLRSFQAALASGKITSESRLYKCPACATECVFSVCERCGEKAKEAFYCSVCGILDVPCDHDQISPYQKREIDIRDLFANVQKFVGGGQLPDLIKGVRGTSNKEHTPEHLAKGIFRAQNGICVNKDGTTRYDMTQLVVTHFRPEEIGTSVERLVGLGYTCDMEGAPLTDNKQLLELKPQDLILPGDSGSPEEGAHQILYRTASFLDSLLTKLYKLPAFYKLSSPDGLVGHLVNALAPHISSSVIGRIIGFSKTQGFFAHPMFHAALRRDCDGDEASVTLLLDTLLNFSRQFLPSNRGATQDASLVMTSRIVPSEVDDMVFDLDVAFTYPLGFYEAALAHKQPWDVKIEQLGHRLNTPQQYEGMGFTHDTLSISHGVRCSAYKTLPSMEDKLKGQMDLAEKIRAVDEADVATLVIDRHFIRDIKGNLRKFSQQQFRCVECNEKFRRPPLKGTCSKCNGKLLFTISEGSIVKYLQPAISLAEKYDLTPYMQQSLDLTKKRVEGIFGRDKEKQAGLGSWFS